MEHRIDNEVETIIGARVKTMETGMSLGVYCGWDCLYLKFSQSMVVLADVGSQDLGIWLFSA